jgi:hypothetical protein
MGMKYRRKGPEVEAEQWGGDNASQLAAFTNGRFQEIEPEDRGDDPEATGAVRESRHNTWVPIVTGDVVIKDERGEISACRGIEFAETYELSRVTDHA